jgi:hypothetical protein
VGEHMSDPAKTPTAEELLARITALEAENKRILAYVDRLIKQVGGVLENIGSIDEQLFGLMDKVFPGYLATQGHIAKVLSATDKDIQEG